MQESENTPRQKRSYALVPLGHQELPRTAQISGSTPGSVIMSSRGGHPLETADVTSSPTAQTQNLDLVVSGRGPTTPRDGREVEAPTNPQNVSNALSIVPTLSSADPIAAGQLPSFAHDGTPQTNPSI